jgi:glycerophosphoryl diester phosphodiesterase
MILYGHRGARGEAPENTLTGFTYARRLGVEAFEFDVHLAADGELVVIHDPTVDRTTNGTGPVAAFTAAELARLDARSVFPAWPEPAGVPRLTEVLAVVGDARWLEIEIKTDTPERLERVADRLLAQIAAAGIGERTTVSSFDPVALEIVRRLAPEQRRGFIAEYAGAADLETAIRLGCAQADVPLKTGSAEIVAAAHARGLTVTGWQGNTPEDVRALLAWDVDHISSDYPSVAMAVLREAGASHAA